MITKEDIVKYLQQIMEKNALLCKEYEIMLGKIKDERTRKILQEIYDDQVLHKKAVQELTEVIKGKR